MKLERHVGGLSKVRKVNYLRAAGWQEVEGAWLPPIVAAEPYALNRAVHHQLTGDLCRALEAFGWKVDGYSMRGYARLIDPKNASLCSLPAALRREARRRTVPVAQLTRQLFEAALRV